MNQIPYKWIALGILIGYLSPYLIALIKSYQSPLEQKEEEEEDTLTAYEL